MTPPKLLILGGTQEAAELARRATGHSRWQVTTSLAGRTQAHAELPGQMRIGGFGGVEGLSSYLTDQRIDLLVDATHPFAVTMSQTAAAACSKVRVPRLMLNRPEWRPQIGDNWIHVTNGGRAAVALEDIGPRVFLSTGRWQIASFTPLKHTWFLVRLIDTPNQRLPLCNYQLHLRRGPFCQEAELKLLRSHRINAVVSKNSGGDATYGKIIAARSLGLPVVMIERPTIPTGEVVSDVEGALRWLKRHSA